MRTLNTLLQIDLQNLFYGAKNKDQRVDLEKIWDLFNERETEILTEAIIYTIRSASFDSSKFETKLKSVGYKIKIKNAVKTFVGENRHIYKQSNQDIPIVIDCMDRLDQFDKLILMSGDGDFADLCEYLKKKKKKIEIWSFKKCYNQALSPFVDKVNFIEESSFIYKKLPVKVFGINNNL